MKPWQRVVLLCALIAGVLAEKCERQEAKQGCTVEDGHAQCEAWNMTASIAGLPTCTTKITFSLLADPGKVATTKYTHVCLQKDADFSRLSDLQELTIRTNRQNFSHIRMVADRITCFQALQQLHLRVLRFQMLVTGEWLVSEENAGMYSHFRFLDTFEITRGQRNGLSAIMHGLGPKPSMKILTLKNVQQFRTEGYTSTLDLAYFVCGGNVRQLDLSYNDIVALNVSSNCWNSKLQYLNLDHNLLAQTIPVKSALVHILPMLAGLQVFRASSSGSEYQSGLWDEPDDINLVDVSENTEIDSSRWSIMSSLQQTPVGFLAGFDYWLRDLLKTCEHKTYQELVSCAVKNPNDDDAFFLCWDPNLSSYSCFSGNAIQKFVCMIKHNCKFSCEENIPIPIPPNLRSVSMHRFGKFANVNGKITTCKNINLSIHPNNNLQVVDMPSFNLHSVGKLSTEGFTISGLHNMKHLNLQNHPTPFLLSRMNISDMKDLEELHIGGGRVSEDDILPRHSLEPFTKLSVLDLSNSSLRGFETDVFLKHTHLAVLDLSHNQLTTLSLSSLDLSHTGLVSLNLSHNQLTSIPSSLRHQLESIEGLELYLSGNTFICNCDNLAFLEWVQSGLSITLHYAGDLVCADSLCNTIHNIDVHSLHCGWHWKQPLIVVCSLLAAILLVTALVMMYKKRFHISNLVFRLQERFCVGSGDSASTIYTFDAFIVYSSTDDDRTWVHHVLRKVLEEDFGFRLCIHHRNFPAGRAIEDNIEKAIRTSRKVLLVISENFLQSAWCLQEVQMTSSIDRRKFVIVIYKDVLFSGVHIPTEVRHVLETTTYIEWNHQTVDEEKLFWKRLRRALYNKHQENQRTAGQQDQLVLLNEI